MSSELLSLIMFLVAILALLLGFPVALTLGGTALIFAFIGDSIELFNIGMVSVYPLRILGIMKNEPLVAVPLFIFMGVMLEKTNIAMKDTRKVKTNILLIITGDQNVSDPQLFKSINLIVLLFEINKWTLFARMF